MRIHDQTRRAMLKKIFYAGGIKNTTKRTGKRNKEKKTNNKKKIL